MRENRTYGSEGGEAKAFPTPIRGNRCSRGQVWIPAYAGMSASVMLSCQEGESPSDVKS